ncbi:MAG: hypothetical protein GXY83_20015 [Rhodopirellula sp.]|nr:hypothetical protein [Rhodopirellula sp.]
MNMQCEHDLEATRQKLKRLQEHYERRLRDASDHSRARELSLRSLKSMMNQLTEEIVRYETHTQAK